MSTIILAYHAVGDVERADDLHNLWVRTEQFADQLRTLARRAHVVSLDDLVAGRVPAGRRAVAITFDDGYRSVLTTALPMLEAHGFPATVFVPTAHIGDRNRWDGEGADDLDILDADDLRELTRRGVAIESHGHAHVDLATADEGVVRRDLEQSIATLTDVVGAPPSYLAYPFRTGSPAARTIAAELGFRAAFSIDIADAGRFAWGRVYVGPRDGRAMFRFKTSGYYLTVRHHPTADWLYRSFRRVVPRAAEPR